MKCAGCGHELKRTRQTVERTVGDQRIKVFNVPVRQCEHCGDSVLSELLVEQIDRLLRQRGARGEVDSVAFEDLPRDDEDAVVPCIVC